MICGKCKGGVNWKDFNKAIGQCEGECKGEITYHSIKYIKLVGWNKEVPISINK